MAGRWKLGASSGSCCASTSAGNRYSRDGAWNYEPIVNARRIAAGAGEASGAVAKIEARVDWGRYRLEGGEPGWHTLEPRFQQWLLGRRSRG